MVIYTCEVCNKLFDRQGNYLKHKNTHSNDEIIKEIIIKPTCQYCKKTFVNNGKLKYHIEHICKLSVYREKLNEKQIIQIQMGKMKAEMQAEM